MEGLVMKYFVLSPYKDNEYGIASRKAIITYSRIIKEHNPTLSEDLQNWVASIKLGLCQ